MYVCMYVGRYLYGQYKRINHHCGQIGKGLLWGGCPQYEQVLCMYVCMAAYGYWMYALYMYVCMYALALQSMYT